MLGFLVFVLAQIFYFSMAYVSNRIFDICFPPPAPQSWMARPSGKIIAGFMTVFSLGAVVLLPKTAFLAPLALPGAYAGLILSMLITGNQHGPGDPYSWILFAAPINFLFYYGLVRLAVTVFPSQDSRE